MRLRASLARAVSGDGVRVQAGSAEASGAIAQAALWPSWIARAISERRAA